MKKKLLSVLMATVMTMSLAACGSSDQGTVTNNAEVTNNDTSANDAADAATTEPTTDSAEVTAERPTEPTGQIVIGNSTTMECDFYDTAYNNSAFNYKAYDLIHGGADTVVYTKEGMFEVNPTVVANLESTDNEDGSKTYTIQITDKLVWSDGSAITAKDYIFAALLESSPEMMAVDNYPANGTTVYVGYNEYNAGETEAFKGFRLIDDYTFSMTVMAEELPYHYDIYYASARPRPMSVIAPGCDVVDTEDGAMITGDFTTDLLMKTIADPDTGYRYNPQVTCGPYNLVSYDQSSNQAVLEVNDKFLGDYRGVKPVIKKVILKTTTSATELNELEAGTVDVLFSVSGGSNIEAGLDLVDAGKAQKHTYLRNGYGKIAFDCSTFPTDSEKVRQAVAYCLDRNEFARQYSGGYASIVHSRYGLAQWEYQESKDWIDQNLNTYEKDIEAAKAVLVEDGWTLNASGEEYKDGDGVRYKDVNGELKPLVIEWCNSEGNPVSELLSTMLPEAMEEAGMELKSTTVDFPTLLDNMAHEGEMNYNMFNLATGFSSADSPWYYYSTDEKWMTSGYNSNWIKSTELEAVTSTMQNLPYDAKDEWLENWRAFMLQWNTELPDVPLYSDEYHDFFSNKLQGWDTSSIWDWNDAILDAWVTE